MIKNEFNFILYEKLYLNVITKPKVNKRYMKSDFFLNIKKVKKKKTFSIKKKIVFIEW